MFVYKLLFVITRLCNDLKMFFTTEDAEYTEFFVKFFSVHSATYWLIYHDVQLVVLWLPPTYKAL
jgi:hypothetical protein